MTTPSDRQADDAQLALLVSRSTQAIATHNAGQVFAWGVWGIFIVGTLLANYGQPGLALITLIWGPLALASVYWVLATLNYRKARRDVQALPVMERLHLDIVLRNAQKLEKP